MGAWTFLRCQDLHQMLLRYNKYYWQNVKIPLLPCLYTKGKKGEMAHERPTHRPVIRKTISCLKDRLEAC